MKITIAVVIAVAIVFVDNGVAALPDEVIQDPNAPLGMMTLFEGNGATQNVVCNLFWEDSDKFWNFQDYDQCQNDETRSALIEYAEAGTIITVFDSPSGSKDDDYTVIKIRNKIIDPLVIYSFEEDFSRPELEVVHHHVKGLNGKVSRIEITVF